MARGQFGLLLMFLASVAVLISAWVYPGFEGQFKIMGMMLALPPYAAALITARQPQAGSIFSLALSVPLIAFPIIAISVGLLGSHFIPYFLTLFAGSCAFFAGSALVFRSTRGESAK